MLILHDTAFVCHTHSQISGENCLQTGNGNGLPNFTDYGGGNSRIIRHNQAIITSYKFECDQMCGNITEWGVDVYPGGPGYHKRYTLDLQVWKPSPTVNDSTGTGQYSLVGNNRFTSISNLSDEKAIVTPSPQDYIQFQPGDMLGFYVEEARFSTTDGVVVLTSPSSFTSEVVWYASIEPAMATTHSVYSVGSSGDLNSLIHGAPVISIETGKSELEKKNH